jgi:hypothetical protein
MKVKNLIEMLSIFPSDAEVIINVEDNNIFKPVLAVEFYYYNRSTEKLELKKSKNNEKAVVMW